MPTKAARSPDLNQSSRMTDESAELAIAQRSVVIIPAAREAVASLTTRA